MSCSQTLSMFRLTHVFLGELLKAAAWTLRFVRRGLRWGDGSAGIQRLRSSIILQRCTARNTKQSDKTPTVSR